MDLRQSLKERRIDLSEGKAVLERRIADLEATLEQTKINLFATDGALQECEYWIAKWNEANEPEDESADIGV